MCILAGIFLYFGLPWIHGRLLRLLLKHKVAKADALILTFDDGPSSRLTPAILEILSEYNAKATFFLLGEHIQGREAIVRQIVASGHEICSHGYKHIHYWRVSPFRALADIRRGWQAINTVLGTQKDRYPFRPPHGKLNHVCLLYLLLRNVPIVYWSIDVGDTWAPEQRDVGRTASLIKKAGGAVTLAHDFDRSDDSVDNMIIDSIRSALMTARESGLHTLTISQLLNGE